MSEHETGPTDAGLPEETSGLTGQPAPPEAQAPAPRAPGGSRGRTPPFLRAITKEIRDGDLNQPMHIGDFMLQLGLHYKLPEKAEMAAAAAYAAKVRRTRRWLVALAVLVVIAGGAVPLALREEPEAVLPAQVLGEWRTNSPRYSKRGFTFLRDRVRLDFGDQAVPVEFPVSEVRRVVRGDTTVFEVFYRQDQGLTRFQFDYVESAIPFVRLPNPSGVNWFREKDIAVPRALAATRPESLVRGSPLAGPDSAGYRGRR